MSFIGITTWPEEEEEEEEEEQEEQEDADINYGNNYFKYMCLTHISERIITSSFVGSKYTHRIPCN